MSNFDIELHRKLSALPDAALARLTEIAVEHTAAPHLTRAERAAIRAKIEPLRAERDAIINGAAGHDA
ncbi:hypothetical protein [Numidum massiliense]|uniref:hypothetical protein n=1 Tax=Numidum massiliense TaxID=1522315 RepID=UPI0006D5450E|nr:hypothetical protein [Numidum massiliense]